MLQANGVTMEVFDAVMICTGHHVHPHIPNIYGMEDFRGPKLHSHEYKRPEPFQDKRVLVIGKFSGNYVFIFKSIFFFCRFYPFQIFTKCVTFNMWK